MRVFLFAAAACALVPLPAAAQPSPETSQAQDLTNCAGAVAAQAGVNVVTFAGNGGEWSDLLAAILARLNREPGVEGMTGRYAASAAREFWAEQPRAEREAYAEGCRERFGG